MPNYDDELQQLQKEGEMPLDDLLASLPPEMLTFQGEGTPLLEDEGDGEAEANEEEMGEEGGAEQQVESCQQR